MKIMIIVTITMMMMMVNNDDDDGFKLITFTELFTPQEVCTDSCC